MFVSRWRARDRRQASFVITGAQQRPSELHALRKRRYAITMGIRAVCVVAAAIAYRVLWLMLLFAVAGTVLPLFAVIMANDRLPRKRLARYGVARRPRRTRPTRPPMGAGRAVPEPWAGLPTQRSRPDERPRRGRAPYSDEREGGPS